MKKIVLTLTMILMLAFSAVCSASNGKVLDSEENIVNKFINAADYKAISSVMTEDMKKGFTAETFANYKAQVEKNFGALSENKLMIVEKHNGFDVLRYQSKFAKVPQAQYLFVFTVTDEKPLLANFNIVLPPKEEAKEAQK